MVKRISAWNFASVEMRLLWESRGLWKIYIILTNRTRNWEERRGNGCEQDAQDGGSGVRGKQTGRASWVRETRSGGHSRSMTLDGDGTVGPINETWVVVVG